MEVSLTAAHGERRLEIVRLRLFEQRPPGLIEEVRKSIENQKIPVAVRFYSLSAVPTDVAIHIQVGPEMNDRSALELGARLAFALKAYGMVEHSIWLEEQSGTEEHSK